MFASIIIKDNNYSTDDRKVSTVLSVIPHPQLSTIYDISHELGALTSTMQQIAYIDDRTKQPRRNVISAQCLILSQIFQIAKLEIERFGSFTFPNDNIPPSKLLFNFMKDREIAPKDLDQIHQFINWDMPAE
jgi:hypothetical protein